MSGRLCVRTGHSAGHRIGCGGQVGSGNFHWRVESPIMDDVAILKLCDRTPACESGLQVSGFGLQEKSPILRPEVCSPTPGARFQTSGVCENCQEFLPHPSGFSMVRLKLSGRVGPASLTVRVTYSSVQDDTSRIRPPVQVVHERCW